MSHLPRQHGFSLLELLLVLGLMATAAVLALSAVSNDDNQRRFEETRSKLERLRVGIVGEPLVINNELSLNGFVADMGRLPDSLSELLSPDDCDFDTAGDQPCPDWIFDEDSELWSGWNGPYINTIDLGFQDGWGKDWDWEDTTTDTQPGDLTIASYGLDTDTDVDTNDLTGPDTSYGNSALQTVTVNNLAYAVQLPFSPLHLSVEQVPFCGQCQDLDSIDEAECDTAGHDWSNELGYCVENTATSATSCAAVSTEETAWIPLYSYCSASNYTNQSDCEEDEDETNTWYVLDGSINACSLYSGASGIDTYDFLASDEESVCARIIHANQGIITAETHQSDEDSVVDIVVVAQSELVSQKYIFNFDMETDEDTPVEGLTLPQGNMRVGLFIYDTVNDECTDSPYVVTNTPIRSDIITLSSDYPPNIGTSSNPITLHWRSR